MPDKTILIDTKSLDGYRLFLKCKALPRYTVIGNEIHTDEKSYQYVFGGEQFRQVKHKKHSIEFDYQHYVIDRALEREKYAAFLDCGLGKTIIELMFIHDVVNQFGGRGVFWCPLSVLEDIQRECFRIYGYRMSNLRNEPWKTDIAIINWESMRPLDMKNVSACVVDESSILKSGDGAISDYLIQNSCNVKFRLDCSATPSPNDQTEYASHAVHLGVCSTQKEFYSRFFVKDGTEWRMKNHAKDAFYDFLKSWACYIQSPSSIGFEQGAELNEDPEYIILESYPDQKYLPEGKFFADSISLSDSRKIFTDLRCDKSEKRFIDACESIKNDRSIIWCNRNREEEAFSRELGAVVINGQTPIEKRVEIIDAFKRGEIEKICSKPSVLGFGVNIQEAESHLYSGYNFSFEEFYQAIHRSHRYGREGRLKVYVPVSEPERPVWDILNRKLSTFKNDVSELQKRFFGGHQGGGSIEL
jgi:hypothetical protein